MIIKMLSAGVIAASLVAANMTPASATAGGSEREEIGGILSLLFLGAVNHDARDTGVEPKPKRNVRRKDSWRVLPANCRRCIETRRGDMVHLYNQRCLSKNYRFVNRLPQKCHERVRTENGQWRQGYGARCLRNAGFRTTQH